MDIISRYLGGFFAFIACVAVILAFIILLVIIIPFFIYDYIKLKIYRHAFFVPSCDEQYKEMCEWVSENISGPVWITDISDDVRENWYGYAIPPLGWSVRFIRKTDAMAFKLAWIGII